MTALPSALPSALAGLYAAFPDAAPSATLPAALHGPRRQLGANGLEPYAQKAPHGLGTADDYARLLPRLLELLVAGAPLTARGLTWARQERALLEAGWERWPEPKTEALRAFAQASWAALLAGDVKAWDAADLLRFVTRLRPDDTASMLGALKGRKAAPVRRALVAELTLKDGVLEGWGSREPARSAVQEAALAAGMLGQARVQARREHPAEETVRIWFCDPWRGVELSEELAAVRGADQSTYRRRLQRWKKAIRG